MITTKPVPDLIGQANRFPDKIMHERKNQKVE
jgi:hypothetical protein